MFIMIFSNDTYNKVIPFKDFIPHDNVLDLINDYILNDHIAKGNSKKTQYNVNMYNNTIFVFSMNKYDYQSTGLLGNYDDFYEYSDASNKTYIVSPNKEKLKGFCGYINRLTCL